MKIKQLLEDKKDHRQTTYTTRERYDVNGTQCAYSVSKTVSRAEGLHVASYTPIVNTSELDPAEWAATTADVIQHDLWTHRPAELLNVYITVLNEQFRAALFEQFRARLNADWYIRTHGNSIEMQCTRAPSRVPSSRLNFVRGNG